MSDYFQRYLSAQSKVKIAEDVLNKIRILVNLKSQLYPEAELEGLEELIAIYDSHSATLDAIDEKNEVGLQS